MEPCNRCGRQCVYGCIYCRPCLDGWRDFSRGRKDASLEEYDNTYTKPPKPTRPPREKRLPPGFSWDLYRQGDILRKKTS